MSKADDKSICIYFIGQDHGVYQQLFQKAKEETHNIEKQNINILKGENKNFLKKENSILKGLKLNKKHRLKILLTGYKYPEIVDGNIKIIIFDVYNSIKNSLNKKNIIICFENTSINHLSHLNNKLEVDKPFILFHFPNETDFKDSLFRDYKYPQFINYFIASNEIEPEKFLITIISFILDKSCYYLEEGNNLNKYFPNNILYKEPKGFLYLNILLTGESRAGKSCFINRIMNKLVSFESSKLESSTRKINSYELYPPEEEQKEKKLKTGYGGIKIYDTPGLVKINELNSFELIKNELGKIFHKIHIVYFFIKAQSNLEQCINMLKYIKEINKERKQRNLFKIPILFIKNGEDLDKNESNPIIFQELIKELEKNDLLDLYDSSINTQNKTKVYNIDNFFDDEKENNNDYDNYINGNIIQVQIPTGKNINKIFSITKEYIIKNNNNLFSKDFFEYKNYTKKLIQYFIKEQKEGKSLTKDENEDYKRLYNICKDIVNDFKKNNCIIDNLDILEIKSKAKKLIGTISFILLPFSIFIIPLFLAIPFMYLYESNTINNIALKYGFGERDLFEYGLNNYIYPKKDQKEKKDFEIEKLEKKCKELFEQIIYYIGPIQCLIKSKELFLQIIDLLTELSNRKEEKWNNFQIEKI